MFTTNINERESNSYQNIRYLKATEMSFNM